MTSVLQFTKTILKLIVVPVPAENRSKLSIFMLETTICPQGGVDVEIQWLRTGLPSTDIQAKAISSQSHTSSLSKKDALA